MLISKYRCFGTRSARRTYTVNTLPTNEQSDDKKHCFRTVNQKSEDIVTYDIETTF